MGQKARQKPKYLAAKLRAVRLRLGLSQFEFVKLLRQDISYHRLSEYESGRREPNLLVLLAYARVASVPVETLIDDKLDVPK
jgi:transcriptional regulator with XRE-family HTH domain